MIAHADALAERLDRAAVTGTPISGVPELTFDEAVSVQRALLRRRAERGDNRVGIKLAFTNRAMMQRYGIAEPAIGGLTAAMKVPTGGTLDATALIRPRVECELIVRLRTTLSSGSSRAQALAAIDAIAPAMEIVDSRIAGTGFNLTEIVADNASAAAFVAGAWHAPDIDLDERAVLLAIDGHTTTTGSTSAIFGHPLDALRVAADLSVRLGEPLAAGTLVLLGSATDPLAISAGQHITASIAGLGAVSFSLSSTESKPLTSCSA